MPAGNRHLRDSGKTIINTLVAVVVVVLLLTLLVPALMRNRSQARSYVCEDNLKQLGQAAQQYAADNQGKFFPQWQNKATYPGTARPDLGLWCDDQRLGKYVTDVKWVTWKFAQSEGLDLKEAVNGIVRCPQADEAELRSYAQNHWANGLGLVKNKGWDNYLGRYRLGEYFDAGSDKLDKLMLFVESNATQSKGNGWVSRANGGNGRPSDRFTGGIHVYLDSPIQLRPSMPTRPPSRYRYEIPWVMDYSRHGSVNNPFVAEGETNTAFADGHVARFSHKKLYDPATRVSTYEALWSLNDPHFDELREPYGIRTP